MIEVKAGQSLRTAVLNAPTSETVISVEAGATFNETIELPAKDRSSPLVIQSSRIGELPADRIVSPQDSDKMPKIIPPSVERSIKTLTGAHHYSFLGIEVTHDPSLDIHTSIALGDPSQTSLGQVPYALLFDRCYIHGHPNRSSVRAIALNSGETTFKRCYISEIHHEGNGDTQAICGWAGPGPYTIEDCYLESAGENVLWGGADPKIVGLIPSDIVLRRCKLFKPRSWNYWDKDNFRSSFGESVVWTTSPLPGPNERPTDRYAPRYVGPAGNIARHFKVKNLLETKNCKKVLVDGCLLENCWPNAQVGFGVLIKSNNQDETAPWSVTEDFTFSNNIVRGVEHGINMLGVEYPPKVSEVTKRIKIVNNFWEVQKMFAQMIRGGQDYLWEHNTYISLQTGEIAQISFDELQVQGFVMRNNLGNKVGYGIKGSGVAEGVASLNAWCPGWTVEQNAFIGADPSVNPPNNFYPKSADDVGFDLAGRTYRLASTSPYKNKGTDGKDLGVDWDSLEKAQQQQTVEPPPPTEVSIRGKILKKDGTPIKGARVMINPGVKTQLFTKDDGSFAFVGLKPGRYVVIAGASNAWWVYQPGYRAFDAKQDVVNADFVAVDSNDPSLFI